MRILFFIVILFNLLFAHKLNIFIIQEEQTLHLNAYFASGKPCQSCQVEVLNAKDELLIQGITNNQGDFEINRYDEHITVSVDAGSGHKQIQSFQPKMQDSHQKEDTKLVFQLKQENAKLKRQIALLEEKNSFFEMLKIVFALCVIGGIFFILKRVKK